MKRTPHRARASRPTQADEAHHQKQAKDLPKRDHARRLKGRGGAYDCTHSKPVWLLPRSHKKWKPRPGRTARFDDKSVATLPDDTSNQPIHQPQWALER